MFNTTSTMKNARQRFVSGLLATAVMVGAFAVPMNAAGPHSVKFRNQSGYAITQVRISPASSDSWGPDRLSNILYDNWSVNFTLWDGVYDFMLVDQDLDTCILRNVRINESEDVTITRDELLGCERRH